MSKLIITFPSAKCADQKFKVFRHFSNQLGSVCMDWKVNCRKFLRNLFLFKGNQNWSETDQSNFPTQIPKQHKQPKQLNNRQFWKFYNSEIYVWTNQPAQASTHARTHATNRAHAQANTHARTHAQRLRKMQQQQEQQHQQQQQQQHLLHQQQQQQLPVASS